MPISRTVHGCVEKYEVTEDSRRILGRACMSRMRVGVITSDFFPFIGGMGRGIYEIFCKRLMNDSSLEFFFFSPCANELPNHTQVAKFSRRFGRNGTFSIVVNKNINKWVRTHRLDVLSLHGGTGGVFLLREPDIPVIYTCHGTLYRQYKSTFGQRWKWILYKLEQASYARAHMVRAISKDVRDIIVTKYGIEPEKVRIIYNGVDADEFRRMQEIDRIPNSLLFVGRVEQRKGIRSLIERVIPLVNREIPDIKLFVAGAGSLREKLEAFVKSHRLDSNVVFLGWLSSQELVKWYNRVCIAVVPPSFEAFGQTITEAMSCGTPIIATRVPAIYEIVEDGENGILVAYGDSKALSEAIIGLLGDDALQRKFSLAGRRAVEQKFSWDIVAGEMKAAFLSMRRDSS